MKINELIFPKDARILKPGIHQVSNLPIEKIIDFVSSLHQKGKPYKIIFDAVRIEFGPDARSYVVKNIGNIIKGGSINEEFWSYPSSGDKIKQLKIIISRPSSPEQAKKSLMKILSSRQLFDVLDTLRSDEDAVPSIVDYIRQQFPNLYLSLSNEANKKDINNCDGTLSPLGHESPKENT